MNAPSACCVTVNRRLGPVDHRLQEMAKVVGAESTFYPTDVGVFFGPEGATPGTSHDDPYFGGEGPSRKSHRVRRMHGGMPTRRQEHAGQNYLFLAERRGAKVFPETKVVDVRPAGNKDGTDGYIIETVSTAVGGKKQRKQMRARGIVFAASSLGTQELLVPAERVRFVACHFAGFGTTGENECRVAHRSAIPGLEA
jgi:cholesterol oxidase